MISSLPLAVVPVLIGPLQVLLALLPGILLALFSLIVAMFKPSALKKGGLLLWRLKIPLILIAGVGFGLWKAAETLWPRDTEVGTFEMGDDTWSMFRGGPHRPGTQEGTASPNAAGTNWVFSPKNEAFFSSPTVLGNRIYAVSAEYGVFADRGAIYCLDADSGDVVWAVEPDNYRASFSSPSISPDGSRLVVGEGLHLTKDAQVFCLDISPETIAAKGEPQLLWSYRTKSHVESSPAIADGRAVIGAGDDGYYCFDLEPDENGEPVILWHKTGERYKDAECPPLIWQGRVYVGLGLEGEAVVCLDAVTGEEIWRTETPFPVFSPISALPPEEGKPDRVVIGMGVGDFVNDAEGFLKNELDRLNKLGASPEQLEAARRKYQPGGKVWCLDAETGEVQWKRNVERVVLGAVVPKANKLVVGSRNGHLYELDADSGEILREFNTHEAVIASPAVTETHVYVSCDSGRVYCLDLETFELVWSQSFGDGGMAMSSPAVARGQVFVGIEKGGLFSLGSIRDQSDTAVWTGLMADDRHRGTSTRPTLPDQGDMLGQFPEMDGETGGRADMPPAVLEGTAFVGLNLNGTSRLNAVPLVGQSGFGVPRWSAELPGPMMVSPAVGPDTVYAVGGELHALDRESGSLRWRHPVGEGASGAFRLDGGLLLIADTTTGLSALNLNGEEVWRAQVGRVDHAPAIDGPRLAVSVSDPAGVVLLDRDTGAVLWRAELTHPPTTAPVDIGSRLLVGGADGLRALDLITGSELWRTEEAVPASPLVVGLDRVAFTDGQGTAWVKTLEEGATVGRMDGMQPGRPPLPVQDDYFLASPSGIVVWDPESTDPPAPWMDTSWMGPVLTPMVMDGEAVIFGTEQFGWIKAGRWQ